MSFLELEMVVGQKEPAYMCDQHKHKGDIEVVPLAVESYRRTQILARYHCAFE
jgi:hypothetical protein